MTSQDLPIAPYLETIVREALGSPSRYFVLTAETGAGKSTAVPQAFLSRVPGKILLLEPRRVAAMAIASRIAETLGEEPGGTVGWRMRLDTRVSARTRIEVVTEAVLTRIIQSDPELSGVSAVILDEFHERSIHGDLALALLADVKTLRDDLLVMVMSATIDSQRISSFLDAPALHVPGRTYPVEIRYTPSRPDRFGREPRVEDAVAGAVLEIFSETSAGDILAFLPGIAEIRRAAERLPNLNADVHVLHSSVPLEEQRRILSPPPVGGRRRVILSSSIAETSVTVPGVSIVVDSGISRTGRIDLATGMYRLVTGPESEFSAAQRAGRAGRTGPGLCVRLWAERDLRVQNPLPEIMVSDLASTVLECALWGVHEPGGLRWLDMPRPESWSAARELLSAMGALDAEGRITERGRLIASLPVHPRIAAVALTGEIGLAVRFSGSDPDSKEGRSLFRELQAKLRKMGCPEGSSGSRNGALALLAGFPDRLARHCGEGRYRFPSGRVAALPRELLQETNSFPEWIIAPEVDPGEREGRIRSWEALSDAETQEWINPRLVKTTTLRFAEGRISSGRIEKTESEAYGRIVVRERRLSPEPGERIFAYGELLREKGLEALPLNEAARAFLLRARFLGLPDMDDESLARRPEQWLYPFIPPKGILTEEALLEALRYATDARAVDRDAPTRITLENGVSRPLSYESLNPGEPPVPVLEIRIQELFGCRATPRIGGVPVLLKLLSPARRPLQVTRDLEGFWKNTWCEVRKEMRGRYPKHKWPENPFEP